MQIFQRLFTFWNFLLIFNGFEMNNRHAADQHHRCSFYKALVPHVPSSTFKVKTTEVNTFLWTSGNILLWNSEHIEIPTECINTYAVGSSGGLQNGGQKASGECKCSDPESLWSFGWLRPLEKHFDSLCKVPNPRTQGTQRVISLKYIIFDAKEWNGPHENC